MFLLYFDLILIIIAFLLLRLHSFWNIQITIISEIESYKIL